MKASEANGGQNVYIASKKPSNVGAVKSNLFNRSTLHRYRPSYFQHMSMIRTKDLTLYPLQRLLRCCQNPGTVWSNGHRPLHLTIGADQVSASSRDVGGVEDYNHFDCGEVFPKHIIFNQTTYVRSVRSCELSGD